MAEIKYRIRGKKDNSPIYIRFFNGKRQDYEVKSNYFCNPEYFDNVKGKVKSRSVFTDKINLQTKLIDLENDIKKSFNSTPEFTKEWFHSQIRKHHGIEIDSQPKLIKFIENFIDHKTYSSDEEVTNSTIKSYKATLKRVVDFQKHIGKEYFINEVGSDFKDEFIKWAKTVAKYQTSTFNKSLKQLKTICHYAKHRKKIIIDESLFYKENTSSKTKKQKKITFPHLTVIEIEKIKKFKGADYLENSRDWLVISCWTGSRVSDLMTLNLDTIETTIKGDKSIRYTQIKTGHEVQIPIHPDVNEIIERLNGFPRAISHQKYNDYIKEVCEKSDINERIEGSKIDSTTKRKVTGKYPKFELITSHIGRRSFATNHYGKFPNRVIMMVTGHKTEKQFLEYIGKTDTGHIKDFIKYWKEQGSKVIEDNKSNNIG